jgi:orotate phosphoribosyltransferase
VYANPAPEKIVVFDDVLTGGSHFKAMKIVLRQRYPEVDIIGLFLARSIHPAVTVVKDNDVELDL